MIMSPDKLILSLIDNLSPCLYPVTVSQIINCTVALRFIAFGEKIYALPTLFCFILPAFVLSQNNKIDGLKKVWSLLHDRSRVNCVKALSDCGATRMHKDYQPGVSKICLVIR